MANIDAQSFERLISDLLLILLDDGKGQDEKVVAIAEIVKLEGADSALTDFLSAEKDLSKRIVIATAMLAYDGYPRARALLEENAQNPKVMKLVGKMQQLIPKAPISQRRSTRGKPKANSPYSLDFVIRLWKFSEQDDEIGRHARILLNRFGISKRGKAFYYHGDPIS